MHLKTRNSSFSSSMVGSSPSLHHAGWNPAQATLSPAACSVASTDYFTMKRSNSTDSNASTTSTSSSVITSLRRDSSSSSISSSSISSSPFCSYIAYPNWPVHDRSIATSRQGACVAKAVLPPPVQMPTSYITDDELAAIDFAACRRRSNASAEYEAGAQGISWSQTKQPCVPQREERRRRLPPPPPGMATITSSSNSSSKRKSSSKERRRKALSMIME